MKFRSEAMVTRVLLMDAYCSSHVGNDVLLESSINFARQIFENPEFVIHAKNASAFEETLGVKCGRRVFPDPPSGFFGKIKWLVTEIAFIFIQSINMITVKVPPYKAAWGVRRASLLDYEECDVAISIGGEMLNDSFRKTLPMYLFMFWLSGKCGNRTIIFPQSIGPLRRGWTNKLTAYVLNSIDIVCPRDAPSQAELTSMGMRGKLNLLSPDVGLAQPMGSRLDAEKYLSDQGIYLSRDRIWVGLTVSGWVEEGVVGSDYLKALAEGLKVLAETTPIGVLIMPANMPVNGNGPEDYLVSEDLHKKISGYCESSLLSPKVVPARIFKAIAGELDFFVSTRMHASIMSTMAITPTLTINTQRKLYGYMERVGQERFSLDVEDASQSQITSRLEEMLASRNSIERALKAASDDQNNQLKLIAEKISATLLSSN